MGHTSDRLSNVKVAGKVQDFNNMNVADASVMPRIPKANTNIPTIMIGSANHGGAERDNMFSPS